MLMNVSRGTMTVTGMQLAPTLLVDITVLVRKDLQEMVARVWVSFLRFQRVKDRTDSCSSLNNDNVLCTEYYYMTEKIILHRMIG